MTPDTFVLGAFVVFLLVGAFCCIVGVLFQVFFAVLVFVGAILSVFSSDKEKDEYNYYSRGQLGYGGAGRSEGDVVSWPSSPDNREEYTRRDEILKKRGGGGGWF